MQPGDILPLFDQLATYDDTKFVRAIVRGQNNVPLGLSPVNLTNLSNGLYSDISHVFPAGQQFVTAQYLVYDDAGYTVLSDADGGDFERFDLSEGGGGGSNNPPVVSNIIGVIDSDAVPVNGIQDTLVTGSARTLTMRLVQDDNGEPFDLSDTTNIAVRFLNADGTVTVISQSDMTTPITVVSAGAGKFTVAVTAAQSALFMTQTPAAFSVLLTTLTGVVYVNMPYQLSIQQPSVP